MYDLMYSVLATGGSTTAFTTPEWITNLDTQPIISTITDVAAKFGPILVIAAALGGAASLVAGWAKKSIRSGK